MATGIYSRRCPSRRRIHLSISFVHDRPHHPVMLLYLLVPVRKPMDHINSLRLIFMLLYTMDLLRAPMIHARRKKG